MGIIAKQSIKGSVYTYAGAALGFISTGLLMPKFFAAEQIGLINLLIAITAIFSQFGGLGFVGVLSRLFPYFRDEEKKHNGVLSLGVIVSFVGFIVVFFVFLLLKPYLIESNSEKSALFVDNLFYLPVLIFFTVFFVLLDNYNKVLFDVASGLFLKELFVRIGNLVIIVIYAFGFINFKTFVFLYAGIYISPTFIISFLLMARKQFFISPLNRNLLKELKREIIKIAGFWIITGFSGMAILRIDSYMINEYLGLHATGIYAISFYFGALVAIPSRALRKISSIVIAESWKTNDLNNIHDVYKKSSINLFLVAVVLFIGLWSNIDNIYKIMPDYISGKYVIFFIAIANIIDMLSGTNAIIIANSKDYRVMSYIMLFTLFLIIVSNMILIPMFQLTGGAVASLIAMSISFVIRYLFLYIKYRFSPFSYKHLIIIGIGIISYISAYFIYLHNFYIEIIVKGTIIVFVFFGLAFILKVSIDMNNFILKTISGFRKNK